MALFQCSRLCGKSMLSSIGRVPIMMSSAKFAQASAGVPKINIKPYEPPKPEHHDVRNARLNRPLSPHLSIYQVQLTSLLSITHRATGMVLSGYAGVLGIGALVLPHDISYYVSLVEAMNLSPASLFILKAMLASPFAYHLSNGIRHLYWDTARGLTIKEVYQTGYMMLAVTTILTIIFAAL